jgi:hypothetical protein
VPSHSYWVVTGSTLGAVRLTEASFPSQKVMLYDVEQRQLGAGGLFFADGAARAATLMADGSAGMRASADANPGWSPNNPTSRFATRFRYTPQAWEAPVGPDGSIVTGRHRWTRGGIAGRDFGAPEVDTGQP